jgi:hypothetical protein
MKSAIISAVTAAIVSVGATAAATTWINGSQIKPHSIPKNRLTRTAISSLRGARGPRGYPGAAGQQGSQGPQGPQGLSGGFDPSKVSYQSQIGFVPAQGQATASAACPTGQRVIGGGFNIVGTPSNMNALQSYASSSTNWTVKVEDLSSTPVVGGTFFANAVCAAP